MPCPWPPRLGTSALAGCPKAAGRNPRQRYPSRLSSAHAAFSRALARVARGGVHPGCRRERSIVGALRRRGHGDAGSRDLPRLRGPGGARPRHPGLGLPDGRLGERTLHGSLRRPVRTFCAFLLRTAARGGRARRRRAVRALRLARTQLSQASSPHPALAGSRHRHPGVPRKSAFARPDGRVTPRRCTLPS